MNSSNNKTTYLISSQVPQFVRDDHETFVQFLEEYYKFMAQEGETEYVAKNFNNYTNIDIIKEHLETAHPNSDYYYESFLQKLYDNFIKLIPEKVLADRSLILKHVKDFYRSRGSEKSVRFLIRILLGKELNEDFGFYYPKRDVIRASDGKWFVENSLRVGDIAVNNTANSIAYNNFINKTITGINSGATATVETVDVYYDKGILVTELKLSNLYRSFKNGEKVFCYYTEEGVDKYLSASLFSGIVISVSLANGGSGYVEGTYVPVEGGGGSGAQVIIESTTKGTLTAIGVSYGGAGFVANDSLLITNEGTGSGARGNVFAVISDGTYHPNSYNIVSSTISLEANTLIGNTLYSNLGSTNANSWISNGMSFWTFANCGPIQLCSVISEGTNYSQIPTLSAQGNTVIKSLGILGRLEIVNGGSNYQVGDLLEFINPFGSYGFGASANVTAVSGTGEITQVKFKPMTGQITGGSGYNLYNLPTVNVSSATGNGANIIVKTLLGYGDELTGATSEIGKIISLKLVSGGTGYTTVPTINFDALSSGSGASATAAITTGSYIYPGRYLNDDGLSSSYNFLQDRDYYQNYSYVVRVNASLKDYKKVLLELTHPAGMRLFGQYLIPTDDISVPINVNEYTANTKFYLSTYSIIKSSALKTGVYNVKTLSASYKPDMRSGTYSLRSNVTATYSSLNSQIIINSPGHWLERNDNVFLQFANASANITNGYYTVTSANTNYFFVTVKNGNTSFVVTPANTSNLRANTGSGNTNSYVTLTQWYSNSNVAINVGDSVNIGGNLVSVIYTTPNSNTIVVFPALPGNLIANTVNVVAAPFNAYGNVKVYDTLITLKVETPLLAGDNVYIEFLQANTVSANANGTYSLLSANSTTITVRAKDVVNTSAYSGNVNVYTKTVIVTSNNHALSNGNQLFINFYTGDTANATNGLYTVVDSTQNTLNIVTANSVTSGGLATLRTSNVTINVASHGFSTNDSVYIWFISGDTQNTQNGYYTANVQSANLLTIVSQSIPTSNGNLYVYRNFMNVSINRTGHGFTLGQNAAVMFETGDLANVANGIYRVNRIANSNSYTILHNAININGNVDNLISISTGTVYVSKV